MTMMIRPVLPHLYKFDVSNIGVIISAALMLVSTVLVALLVSRYAADRFGGSKKKTALFFTGISLFVALALICFFGCAAITVKGLVLSLLLVLSSYEDIKTRECDDFLHLMTKLVVSGVLIRYRITKEQNLCAANCLGQ